MDTNSYSILGTNKISWGSLSIQLDGANLTSKDDLIVEFLNIGEIKDDNSNYIINIKA